MSNSDSFIDEVTEEVRRDRFYAALRRYGWIGIVAVVLIVGGAAWSEYQKAQARAQAEALGDAMLTAVADDDAAARATALGQITAETPEARAMLALLTAAQEVEAGDTGAAVARLDAIATDGEVPQIYRQLAAFKALTLQAGTLPATERRQQFEALAQPGSPFRLLAQEQLALVDIAEGDSAAAIERLKRTLGDAEATSDLQQRALQVIVALGGDLDAENLPAPAN